MKTDPTLSILLVDDDPLVLEVIGTLLAANEFACRTAHDGFEAIRILLESPFDIIISDLRMPEISGFELLGIIRHYFPDTAIIVVSSEVEPILEKSGSLIDAFFRKGAFTHEQLILAIRRVAKGLKSRPGRHQSQASRIARTAVKQIDIASYFAGNGKRESARERDSKEHVVKGIRFSIQDDERAGFRVRGIYDPWEQAWRIKTWPVGRNNPEHDYWVRGMSFHQVKDPMASKNDYRLRGEFGEEDITIPPLERRAVLHLIDKWESIAQRSA